MAVQEGENPKFKPCTIPFALQNKVADVLQELQPERTTRPVKISEWVAPIVLVLNSDGCVGIFGDFRVTVNSALILEKYLVSRLEDIWAKLSGAVKFTKLNLKDEYQQVEPCLSLKTLSPSRLRNIYISIHSTTIRGVMSAPELFQREMKNLLQDMTDIVVHFDNMILTGRDGPKIKLEKCTFLEPEVEYLGHVIEAGGLKPHHEMSEPS